MALVERDGGNLVFTRATGDQIKKHFENNAQAWAGPLAQRDYLHIHHGMLKTEANEEGSAVWVLHPPDEPLEIVSSCTTLSRPAAVNTGKGSRTVTAVVITHIFTRPEFRGKGIATVLLTKVQDVLDSRSDVKVEFSVIYSDFQCGLYERLGWRPYRATQLRILLGKAKVERPPNTEGLDSIELNDMPFASDRDVDMTKTRVTGKRDGNTHARFLATIPVVRLCIWRSKMYEHYFCKREVVPREYGVKYVSPGTSTGVWAWWVHDFWARKLHLCRLVALRNMGMEESVARVLEVAAAEASRCGLREVVLWEPTQQVIEGAEKLADKFGEGAKVTVEDRDENIPCLRWHGGEGREVIWEEREYYGMM
ncbi:hypothetical protein S40285_08399 [Stachybotrys chlorohalonatus IBT 40285]|uniref:N-acetyltransferase domain-containing protein n=1 Tax=Stachybotrys chlorohalonatus (strain IBT 40285) TaxID=1283841 RepID=A0A084QCP2_STAC4|nr:hypothetical protein S40285_08399 [Stachybotrys chlorohalonata IBT 40285]